MALPLAAFSQTDQQFDSISRQAAQAREADRLEDAIHLYRRALKLRPDWAEGWWYLGTLSYDRQQYADAADSLIKETHLVPKDSNGFAMLGLAEAKLNRNSAALAHLTQALALGVGDQANMRDVVLFTQAELLLDEGTFGRAQDILDGLAQQHKDAGPELLMSLGRSVLGIASPTAATSPEMHDLIESAGRAEAFAATRDIQPAMTAYSDLAERYPKVHNVQFAYGRFLLSNHMDDQAVAAFKREIENSPQHLLARLGIAGALLTADPPASKVYAQQAVKLAPKLEEGHYLLGAALLATGSPSEGVSELETARHLNPKDARVYFALAQGYKRLNRGAEAAQARQKFTQLSPAP